MPGLQQKVDFKNPARVNEAKSALLGVAKAVKDAEDQGKSVSFWDIVKMGFKNAIEIQKKQPPQPKKLK